MTLVSHSEHFDESPPRYFTTGEEKELSQRNELQRFDEGGKKSSEVHPMSAEELLRIRYQRICCTLREEICTLFTFVGLEKGYID